MVNHDRPPGAKHTAENQASDVHQHAVPVKGPVKFHRLFWSLNGRYAWDAELEPARASEPPSHVAKLLQERGPAPGAKVLDAGCGTGGFKTLAVEAGRQILAVARRE